LCEGRGFLNHTEYPAAAWKPHKCRVKYQVFFFFATVLLLWCSGRYDNYRAGSSGLHHPNVAISMYASDAKDQNFVCWSKGNDLFLYATPC